MDRYQHKLFHAIRGITASSHGPFLNGFTFGNRTVEGSLTDKVDCRLHSCDLRLDCPGLQGKKVVYIVPVVTRMGNVEVQEPGVGQGDCKSSPRCLFTILRVAAKVESHSKLALHSDNLKSLFSIMGSNIPLKIKEVLIHASRSHSEALPLDWGTEDKISLSMLNEVLAKAADLKEVIKQCHVMDTRQRSDANVGEFLLGEGGEWLPTQIVRLLRFYMS